VPVNRYFTIFGLLPVCPAAGRRPDQQPRGDKGDGRRARRGGPSLVCEERSGAGMRYSEIALRQGEPAAADGRLAQRESASFTPRRSLVRSQYRPPETRSSEVSPQLQAVPAPARRPICPVCSGRRRTLHSFQRSVTPLSPGMAVSKRTERMQSQPGLTRGLIRAVAAGPGGLVLAPGPVAPSSRRSASGCAGASPTAVRRPPARAPTGSPRAPRARAQPAASPAVLTVRSGLDRPMNAAAPQGKNAAQPGQKVGNRLCAGVLVTDRLRD